MAVVNKYLGSTSGLTTLTPAGQLRTTSSFVSGIMTGDIRGAWLADTTAETITGGTVADRSVKDTPLNVMGSLTKTAVASGADLVAFSGFSAADYLEQPYNSDLDFGTGDFCILVWVKLDTTSSTNPIIHRGLASASGGILVRVNSTTNKIDVYLSNTSSFTLAAVGTTALPDNIWQFVTVARSSGVLKIGLNGVFEATAVNTTDISQSGAIFRVGKRHDADYAIQGSLALLRISSTAPSADQIRWIHAVERFWFNPGAVVTIPGTSDAIIDMAYDQITGHHHILTSWGHAEFDGGVLVASEAGSWTKISANNGLVLKV